MRANASSTALKTYNPPRALPRFGILPDIRLFILPVWSLGCRLRHCQALVLREEAAQAAQRICRVEVTGEIGVLMPFQLRTGQEPGINQSQERRRRYNQDARNVEFETLAKVKGILEESRWSDGEKCSSAVPKKELEQQ